MCSVPVCQLTFIALFRPPDSLCAAGSQRQTTSDCGMSKKLNLHCVARWKRKCFLGIRVALAEEKVAQPAAVCGNKIKAKRQLS